MASWWRCLFCGFMTLFFSALLTHYNTERHDTACTITGSIPCGIEYCTKRFDKGNSFAKHVRSSHRVHLYCSPSCDQHGIHSCSQGNTAINNMETGSKDPSEQSSEDFADADHYFIEDDIDENNTANEEQLSDTDVEMDELPDDLAKRYFLKIREENSLTTACAKKIMKTTVQLINTVVSNMKRKIVQSLEDSNIMTADIPNFEDSFEDSDKFLQDMTRQSILGDTYEIGGEHVSMQKIVLGTRKILRKRNGKKRLVDVEDAFYYVPLLETLKAQLQSPILLNFILAGPIVSKDRNSLNDFCDGSFMKNHPLFGIDAKAIKIILYYDDVNVCNPLSNKMHKIGAFYFQLANLPTKYRSKLQSINLLALCTCTNIKQYGIDRVFEPLVEELKKLGDDAGYPFTLNGSTMSLRGGLLAVVADTPASQDAGGFKSSVGGAFRKCRHCMASYNSMQEHFSEDNFTLRCSTDHEKWLNKMENAPSAFLETFYSKKAGITRRSKLLDAPDFDVCEQLPQDLMHIFLEGVLGYEIKYMLRYYIQQGQLSLCDLNSKIQNFQLGYAHKKNKPAPIFERDLERASSSNLGQSASEMWLLSRILPFILHEYVDTSSEYWTCFTTLLEIVAICFSQTITSTEIIYLKQLIRDHLTLFKRLYEAPIIPKQHYMVHIPSLTLMFGPLIRSWTMRFESKHTYFKSLAKNTKNFKNLPYSLTSRYLAKEYAENVQFNKDVPMSSLFKDSIELGKAKEIVDHNERKYALSTIKRFYDIDPPVAETVYLCSSVSIQNKCYVIGENNLVIYNKTADGQPEFGCIKKIWFCEDLGMIFLVLEIRETISFSDTFQAFQVDKCNAAQGYQVTMPADLISFNIVHTYTLNGKSYIPLRENFFV